MVDSGSLPLQACNPFLLRRTIGWWRGPSGSDGVTTDTLVTGVSSCVWFLPKSDATDPAVLTGVEKMLAFLFSNHGEQIGLAEGADFPSTTYVGTVPAGPSILHSAHDPTHLIAPAGSYGECHDGGGLRAQARHGRARRRRTGSTGSRSLRAEGRLFLYDMIRRLLCQTSLMAAN